MTRYDIVKLTGPGAASVTEQEQSQLLKMANFSLDSAWEISRMHLTALREGFSGKVSLVCLLVALTTAACSTLATNKNSEKNLVKAVEDFNNALRWGDYKYAAQWIVPSLQEQFWNQVDQMEKKIRLTDFEIRHVSWDDPYSAQMIIRYRYYYTNEPSVESKSLLERWQYAQELKRWQITQMSLEQLMPE